jgi:hypothetical protein
MILLKGNMDELEILIRDYVKKVDASIKINTKHHAYSYLLRESLEIIKELQNKIEKYENSISDASMETTFNDTYFDD